MQSERVLFSTVAVDTVKAVMESPAMGAAVLAGCWFRCALSPAAVYPHRPLLHSSSYPKESWQSCGHPGKCSHLSGFETRGVEEMAYSLIQC